MYGANRKVSLMIKESKGIGTKIRYNQIRKYVKETAKNLKNKITEDTQYEDFIEYELESQKKLFKKYLKGSNVNFKFPTVEQAITTATFGQYTATSNFENYLNSLESQFFNIWDSNVREGYLTGISTQDVVRKVVGTQAKNAKIGRCWCYGQFCKLNYC